MAERSRYHDYLVGAILVCGLVYPVYGNWVWGGYYGGSGWLAEMGFIDNVLHVTCVTACEELGPLLAERILSNSLAIAEASQAGNNFPPRDLL